MAPSRKRKTIQGLTEPERRLRRLRNFFLAPEPSARRNYWESEADLAAYDAAFAERIAWKWDAVLAELRRLGRFPRAELLVDWGCGTGVAARVFLEHFPDAGVRRVRFYDRSARAAAFALRRFRETHPDIEAETAAEASLASEPQLVLISHVLNELSDEARERLLGRLEESALAAIWVEHGERQTSRALSAARDRLLKRFAPLAPCPHESPCPILRPEHERDWCHFFAPPPPGVMNDPQWARFGRAMGVDLRALPYSFLVLERRGRNETGGPPPAPPGGRLCRPLGRARVHKAGAKLWVCLEEGVRKLEIRKREHGALVARLRKGPPPGLLELAPDPDNPRIIRPFQAEPGAADDEAAS